MFFVTILRCPYRDAGQVGRALSVVRLNLHAHRSRQAYTSVHAHQGDIDSEDKSSFFNDKTRWQKAPGALFCYRVSMTIEGAILLNLFSMSRPNQERPIIDSPSACVYSQVYESAHLQAVGGSRARHGDRLRHGRSLAGLGNFPRRFPSPELCLTCFPRSQSTFPRAFAPSLSLSPRPEEKRKQRFSSHV